MIEGIKWPEIPSFLYWRIGESETVKGLPMVHLMNSETEKPEMSVPFINLMCSKESEIPDFGMQTGKRTFDGRSTYDYKVPVNPDGIQHVAEIVVARYLSKVRYDEKLAPFSADPTPYYGDYR